MGKTHHDQHQIDENHYCSVTFSEIMNGNRLISTTTTKPLYDWRKLKGKFPQTTMWIEWVEGNFTNPTVKVWADLDNPLKRSDYAKLCMSPSLHGTLPEYVTSQEDNSPLTLYIDFHNFSFFLDISFWSSSFINACTFISALTYLSIKEEGRYIFMKSKIL